MEWIHTFTGFFVGAVVGMTGVGGMGAASGDANSAGASADWALPAAGGAPSEDVDIPADPCSPEGCGAMPAPTVTICTCDGAWACTMDWL